MFCLENLKSLRENLVEFLMFFVMIYQVKLFKNT